ncbi:MAG TPA: CBS domain-containing protein [Thermoanaerobaculia bacterium]|nr:CBS domain-containing protein [Thermoanaerobaculia bacterium]
MKARDVMTRDPKVVSADQLVSDALRIMRDEDVGLVPITEGNGQGRVAGVVTDRDIALHLGETDQNPSSVQVRDVMTTRIVRAAPDDDISDVSRKMEESQIRRILVCEGDRLVGVIATADLARDAKKKDVGRVMERISEP